MGGLINVNCVLIMFNFVTIISFSGQHLHVRRLYNLFFFFVDFWSWDADRLSNLITGTWWKSDWAGIWTQAYLALCPGSIQRTNQLWRVRLSSSNSALRPIGSWPKVFVYLVDTERKHPVRKVVRAPLSWSKHSVLWEGFQGSHEERWCQKDLS